MSDQIREKILKMHDAVFGSFDRMIRSITFESINRQALIAEVKQRVQPYLPNLPPFGTLVEAIKESVEAVQLAGQTADDTDLPEELRALVTITREKLAERRTSYEDMVVGVVSQHFDERDLDVMVEFFSSAAQDKLRVNGLLDASLTDEEMTSITTFLTSWTGKKYRAVNISLRNELSEATSKWRNESLEPHREEIGKAIGFTEPAPADAPTPPETPQAA